MLSAMRSGAKSTFIKVMLFGLLLLAMLGLAFTDVQGMFRSGVGTNVVAKIGREKITTTEISRTVQMAIRNQNTSEREAYAAGLPRAVLDQEIDRRLLQKAAVDLGLMIDDTVAAPQIKNILAPLVEKGMTEHEAFTRLLSAYGVSEAKFVSSIKSQIAVDQLVQAITSGARAPQQLVDDAIKYRSELRQGEYFTLTVADASGMKAPTDADLKAHYDKIADRFALPEYRSFSVLVLDKKAMGLEGKIADDVLKQHYEENVADYSSPEMRRISQVIVKEEADAQKLFEQVKATKDLKKAAADAGKGKATYVTSSYAEADLPEEFASKSFDAIEGDVMPPVQTALGWHILHVEQIVAPAVKPFDSVKAQIATELADEKSSDVLYERANKVDDMIAGGGTIEEVAGEFKLTPLAFTKVAQSGMGADGKKAGASLDAFDKVLKEVYTLDKGEASQLIETSDGAFIIAEVTDVTPSVNEAFDAVKDKVAQDLKTNQTGRILDEKAAKILERLKMGEAFEKVATENDKKIVKTEFFARTAPPEKQTAMPRGMLPSLFSLDKAGAATTVSGDDGAIHILKFADRKIEAPKEQSKEDMENLISQLNRTLQNDILDQYTRALMAEYDASVNYEAMDKYFVVRDEEE